MTAVGAIVGLGLASGALNQALMFVETLLRDIEDAS
ncbi:MAG: hypothetical protein ACI9EZ_001518, partial [Halobacteriales archaeon]